MKITAQEFRKSTKKAITLIGMSGAGKSHISCLLEGWGWHNFSCDYVIGAKYLKEDIADGDSLTNDNIGALSEYLGRLGDPEKGGFPLDKFKSRQKSYYNAEVSALNDIKDILASNQGVFIHDSTGSLCEIEDDNLMHEIGENTLFVYLKTGNKEEQEVLQRARDYPKPLFFPPTFLQEKINEFCIEFNVDSVGQVHPDDFSRWVFPILFDSRKPKYQKLADLYGVTICASEFRNLRSSDEFIEIIAEHLDS